MPRVYIAQCPHCEWKKQSDQISDPAPSEECPCCGETFAPRWEMVEHDDPKPSRQATPSAPPVVQPRFQKPQVRKVVEETTAARPTHSSVSNSSQPIKVVVTDFDMSFGSMVNFMVKWVLAAIPAAIILLMIIFLVILFLSAMLSQARPPA